MPGIRSEKKRDTSKIALDEARPVPIGSDPVVRTVRLKAPGPATGGGKVEPLVIAPPAPPAQAVEAMPGIQSKRKSDTSRIDLDAVVKPAEQGAPSGGQTAIRTVRIKSGPTAAAFVGTQPLVVTDPKGSAKPAAAAPAAPAAAPAPQPAVAQEAPTVKPGAGPATIKLKRPDGLKPGGVSPRLGGETARIVLEPPVPAAGAGAQAATGEEQGGPRTVRIKKDDEAGGGGEAAAPVTGRRTMKIARPGHQAERAAPEAPAEEESPLTQRRTLSIKRQTDDGSTDHSLKMAQEEAALNLKRGKKAPGAEVGTGRKPERFAWAWCIISAAAAISIGVVMWMFWVQLNPRIERKFDWPGKILSFNDGFYRDERGWL